MGSTKKKEVGSKGTRKGLQKQEARSKGAGTLGHAGGGGGERLGGRGNMTILVDTCSYSEWPVS